MAAASDGRMGSGGARSARFLEAPDGVTIRYAATGAGSALLLIHGGLVSSTSWREQVDLLSPRHRVITYDQRGFGESGCPSDPAAYGVEISARDALQVLRATDATPAHVVGFSVGGMVALALAAAAPETLRSLVLVSTTAHLTDAQAEVFRVRAARAEVSGLADEAQVHVRRAFSAAYLAEHAAEVAGYAAAVVENDPVAFAATMRALADADMRGVLGEISTPTLVVAGSEDEGMPASVHAAGLNAGIRGSRLAVLPGVGHSVHLEVPADFAGLMLAFFEEVEGRGGD